MELYDQIVRNIITEWLFGSQSQVTFPQFDSNVNKAVEMKCLQTLKKIREVLDDDSLNDEECFHRIEAIVCLFEDIGSNGGSRHDF